MSKVYFCLAILLSEILLVHVCSGSGNWIKIKTLCIRPSVKLHASQLIEYKLRKLRRGFLNNQPPHNINSDIVFYATFQQEALLDIHFILVNRSIRYEIDFLRKELRIHAMILY